jgi:hypothetical protein
MISSGMKRGLAATAVSALAVAGLPFLASSASANTGDTMSVLSQGPIRNGNAAGGSVIIKSTSGNIDPAKIYVTNGDFTSTPVAVGAGAEYTSPAFNVDVISFTQLDGDSTTVGNQPFADGTYHYEAITAVTLGTATKATFGLVEDTGATGVDAADAKTTVEVTPTGAPTSVSVTTAQPATAVGSPVTFNVEIKDAAGNTTQLVSGESFNVTGSAGMTTSTATLNAASLKTGKTTFTGTPTAGGTQSVTVTGATPPAASVTATQSVTVYENAQITPNEFGITTGADTWKDGVTAFGTATQVRVDQNSVTFNFQGKDDADNNGVPDDAGKVVGLVITSPTIKINGSAANTTPVVVPVLLDGAGKGTATVALSNVTAGATFNFSAPGSGISPATTVTMARAAATTVSPASAVYVTKVGSPTDVTVTVKDQFGDPIGAPAQVAIVRSGRAANAGTTARTTVDASGKATISLPDAGTTPGTESFSINLYDDQFASGPTASSPFTGGTINYTADGQGADFTVSGAGSDPATTVITPLNDASATSADDTATISISGATAGTPATVSADGGALILSGADTTLDKGAASKTITLAGGNGTFKVVGTKTGVVTVTIVSGGRTKTVKLTVKQNPVTAIATARNVAIAGPDKAKAGQVATYTATVTDAFGNPVAGVPASSLNFQISGPANQQTTDSVTDANGQFKYNVLLTDNANSPVTVKVTGVPGAATPQFGKAANTVSVTNDAPGISASSNTADATISDVVNIAALQKAVDDAQAKVDADQDAVDSAQGDLNVAKAQQKVAKKDVAAAKKDLKKAKKKHKGVAGAQKALRQARGQQTIANAQVKTAQGKLDRANQRLADDQAALEAAKKDLEDAQNS